MGSLSQKQRADGGRASRKLTYKTLMPPLASVCSKAPWHLGFVGKPFVYAIKCWEQPRAHSFSPSHSLCLSSSKHLNCWDASFLITPFSCKDLSQDEKLHVFSWCFVNLLLTTASSLWVKETDGGETKDRTNYIKYLLKDKSPDFCFISLILYFTFIII